MRLQKNHIKLCDRTIVDGFFGHIQKVTFAFEEKTGHVLVYRHGIPGCHESLLRHAINLQDALWMLDNDPIAKKYYKIQDD